MLLFWRAAGVRKLCLPVCDNLLSIQSFPRLGGDQRSLSQYSRLVGKVMT